MGLINKDTFICLDCESTGLDESKDRIIEVAAVLFTFDEVLDTYETLIDPTCPIPDLSRSIHHISDEMVKGKPTIDLILPELFSFIEGHIIVGHKIGYDISIINNETKRSCFPKKIEEKNSIDTLRLARLYGECPTNSLEKLREHFNIPPEGAHRAMSDVVINIEVFKHLTKSFKTTESLFKRLNSPIKLRTMPLGKHKGRKFGEIPAEYLYWALKKDFDQDLIFSIKQELSSRKKKKNFQQASNPFSFLD